MIPRFRAWHKQAQKIYQVISIHFGDAGGVEVFDKWVTDFTSGEKEMDTRYLLFDEVELMQSIGLPDRKGKEIFEGDICLYSYANDDNPWPWVVVWCSGKNEYLRMQPGWVFADYKHTIKLAAEATLESLEDYVHAEIIGNIHEQPHLNPLDEQVFWQDVEKRSEDNLWWKSLLVQEDKLTTIDEEPY